MQIRMARAALRWKVDDLAAATGIPWSRIQRIEKHDGVADVPQALYDVIRAELLRHQIVFFEELETGRVWVGVPPKPAAAPAADLVIP